MYSYQDGKEHEDEKVIYQYDLDGNFIKTWDSISQASEITPQSSIQHCCKKETFDPKRVPETRKIVVKSTFKLEVKSSELVINGKIINTPVAGGENGLRNMSTFWVVK